MLDPHETQFWQATLRSGLMDVEALAACWNAISPAKREDPENIDQRLARQAVQSNSLTNWQASQLLAGRTSGYKVDRYLLLELIGQGGMGRVYLARDTRLSRRVALKILSPERVYNPRAIARFQREARVGAQLQHENLVRIYDFGESKGRYFLVMEYIEGKNIGSVIFEQGRMPPATAVRLVRQVALGLEHAHRKGLIHRDVNPYNILVTRDGTAKLADLGLAIDLADEERVTRDGATVGTFDYVAPEQARHSRAADIRSDIYSLGCTMYHMLSGNVPFPGPSLPEKVFAHQVVEPTPLDQVIPGLPKGLSEIVQRMMRKSPDARYATPMEVAKALELYGEDDYAAVERREGAPRWAEPTSKSDDAVQPLETRPVAALVKMAAAPADPKSPRSVANTPGSVRQVVDPTPPLLTPLNEFEENCEEVLLVLDPDPLPSFSAGELRPQPSSSPNHPASAAPAPARVGWPAPFWLWGFVVLTVLVTVLIVILATTNPTAYFSLGPRPDLPIPPARDGEFRADSDQTTKSAATQRIRFLTVLADLRSVNERHGPVDVAADL
jgi:serine/threonine protein kinase